MKNVSRDGGDEPRRGQTPGPRETQEGAATPGQGASLAADNVAEPQLGPGRAARAECPPSRDATRALDPRSARVAMRIELLVWLAALDGDGLDSVIANGDLPDEIRQCAREERNRRQPVEGEVWSNGLGSKVRVNGRDGDDVLYWPVDAWPGGNWRSSSKAFMASYQWSSELESSKGHVPCRG